jgi:hypothetical protein
MELENIILREICQVQKAKVTYFLSYVEYRPNTNTAVLWRYEREKVKERI